MKHPKIKYLTPAIVAGTVLALITIGCSEDPAKPGPGVWPPEPTRSSKMGLLNFFAQAHEDRDLDNYEACLHEDYQFWFSEDDISDPGWDWFSWIRRGEDLDLTENMFTAEDVTDIRVTFFNETSVDSAENEEDKFLTGTTTIGDSTVTCYWGDFRLDMHVIINTGDEDLDYIVDGRAYIYLLPDPDDESLWTIWKIEDKGNKHLKSTPDTSWSSMKVMFRGAVETNRTSRMRLIRFFASAQEGRDIDAYEECLREEYHFEFCEDDRADPSWDWKDWIAIVEDLAVTENMFGAEDVTGIRVTFFNETAVDGAQSDEEKFWEEAAVVGEETVTCYLGDFRLDMHVIVDTGDEALDHFVDGRAWIYLLPDPEDDRLWTIWKISDRGNEHLKATEDNTWTQIKAMFR